MANNLNSNYQEKLVKGFLKPFENSRVITKSVDTQKLDGRVTPDTGGVVSFKRPHDYAAIRTSGGDISGSTKSDILSGKTTGVVQDYFTVAVEWAEVDEALKLDELDRVLAPMAERLVTDLETDFSAYMVKNCGYGYGDPDTAITTWGQVGEGCAFLESSGVKVNSETYFALNPFTSIALADVQNSLGAVDSAVRSAWENAQLTTMVGGLKVLKATTLDSFTSGTASDRVGAVNGAPTATYVSAKDTMTQSIAVDGFTGATTINAGEIVEVATSRLNLSTRQEFKGAAGATVNWRGIVTENVTLSSGAGTLVVSGPALYEAGGQYNTVSAAIADDDVITVLGTENTVYQPSLAYRKDAFGMGFAKLNKLYGTDTTMMTKDGFQIRMCRYSDGDSNTQKFRIDLLPAYITFNPFFATQVHG